jgi:hypothetical protein
LLEDNWDFPAGHVSVPGRIPSRLFFVSYDLLEISPAKYEEFERLKLGKSTGTSNVFWGGG